MRPLLSAAVVLASGLVVGIFVPSGTASVSAPGDGCLVIQSGFGNVSMVLSRGAVFGRLQSGTIITEDTIQGDGLPAPKVVGADTRTVLPDGRVRYKGDSIRFRTSGAVKVKITDATLLDLSVVGKGIAFLSAGTFNPVQSNLYSVDSASFCGDNFLPLPVLPAKPVKVTISSPDS
jgi:hypothetical protein